MTLTIINEQKLNKNLDEDLNFILQLVAKKFDKKGALVNLVVCGDETIQELNRKFRNKDAPTDVLSFTYDEKGLWGEVFINVTQARKQAEQGQMSFEIEMFKLFIHGLLHLCGYTHDKNTDFRVMKLFEDEILESLLSRNKC